MLTNSLTKIGPVTNEITMRRNSCHHRHLSIHHCFTLSLEAQNLPFQQILPTLAFLFFTHWTAFVVMWAAVRENFDFLTVVNYTIFAAIIDSFISN